MIKDVSLFPVKIKEKNNIIYYKMCSIVENAKIN